MDRISVSLTTDDWNQVVGILNTGSQLILSQLVSQNGALPKVAELSAIAHRLLTEIVNQVKPPEQVDKQI